jgi:hypothetical protein
VAQVDILTDSVEPRPLFLTVFDTNEHCAGMVADHEARHRAYCERWGYEYRALQITDDIDPYWFRIEVLLPILRSGAYSHVFMIDTDAMAVDFDRDMRETVPDGAFLGMSIHPIQHDGSEVWHFNAGCFYVGGTANAIEFFEEVLSLRGQFPHDQAAMNHLLMTNWRYMSGLNVLSRVWNNSVHDQPHDGMIVAAWHGACGHAERRIWMLEFAKEHGYESN